jgi:hypothetical protein
LQLEGKKERISSKSKEYFSRHRHRLQSRRFLSTSSLTTHGSSPPNHLQNTRQGIPINGLINTTNNNNNDILPAVGM